MAAALFFAYIGLTQVAENVFADSTITVDSSADNTTSSDGLCTLREAVANSNADSDTTSGDCVAGTGTDTIEFDITSNEGVGPHTITLASAITVSQSTIIDGSSETGFVANTAASPAPFDGEMMIEITGNNGAFNGIVFSSGTSTLRGVVVNGFDGTTAIWTSNDGVTTIVGCYVGTDTTGSLSASSDAFGVVLGNGGSVIGGTNPQDRNIFSANNEAEALHSNGSAGINTVLGNYIGLAADGVTALPNAGHGISMYTSGPSLVLGDGTTNGTNVISGNASLGVNYNTDTSSTIEGNYIGTDYTGAVDLGNTHSGIGVYGDADNLVIGGSAAGDKNVISGNGNSGIYIENANNITVQGNYIGTNAAGTADLGNTQLGVLSVTSTNILIGGDTSGERNIISGNDSHGVSIEGASGGSNTVSGNYIGTNAAGTADLGNTGVGVLLDNSPDNTVGGTVSGERNIISGNDLDGIWIYGDSADNNTIQGNYIGTGANGTTDIGNTGRGINISASADSNLVGGTTAAAANRVRFNDDNGMTVPSTGSINNAIIGNAIYHNISPNIDLGDDGITANDANDVDTGPNDLLNFPEWTTVTESGGNTEVDYSLDVPAGNYRIEFFSGNGSTLLDSQNITHTGSGAEDFSHTISGDGYTGLRTTTTEIDGGQPSGFGSTSEYSAAYSDGTETITVNSTADDEDDDGECTLREAIKAANDDVESGSSDGECLAGAGEDTIEFDIAGSGPHTITPGNNLPAITADNITIDGYSETSAAVNTATTAACFNGTIQIEIDGSSAGVGVTGLVIQASNTTIRGLAINDFTGSGSGIGVSSGSNNTVAGNLLGTSTTGLVDKGNGDAGVVVDSAGTGNVIGGTSAADRNLISGNEGFGGISLYADTGSVTVAGNCIGPNATGDAALPNNHHGINIYQADGDITIGGTTSGSRNIISGNDEQGISLDDADVDLIAGNYIGTNVNGTADLGNGTQGIWVDSDASVDLIGGTTAAARNVISGNTSSGITISGGSSTIKGNYIGLSANGSVDLGNSQQGIYLESDNNTIGGPNTSDRNVISGNTRNGIGVNGGSDSNTIQNNYIGLSADGLNSIQNCTSINSPSIGISSNDNAILDNVIGICSGSNPGIQLLGGFGTERGGNTIQGNYIGTDKNGDSLGVTTASAINLVADTSNNLIGGTAEGDGNLIRGNGAGIVMIELEPIPSGQNNSFIGNKIYESDGGGFSNLGIDLLESPDFGSSLVEEGVTPNDANDADAGSNGYHNFPVLDSSSASAGQLNVQFDLDVDETAPNGYRVEFFANDTGDSSGNGEGQIYLGSHNVSGDVTNEVANIVLDPGVITSGTYDITATVTERDNSTDSFGATSEFSAFLNDQNVIQPLDNDGDGVNDSIEDDGPNGGDGNDDGTPDSEQTNVATILDAESDDYITLALDPDGTCNQIEDFSAANEGDMPENDDEYTYPMGMNGFVIPCADSVDGTIYYHQVETLEGYTYRKWGPTTPGDSGTDQWYTSDAFTFDTATVDGETVAVAHFSLTDGEEGDDTGDDNSIVDDNGPGSPVNADEEGSILDEIANILAETGNNERILMLLGSAFIGGGIVIGLRQFKRVNQTR